MNSLDKIVAKKIKEYGRSGGLQKTAEDFLYLIEIKSSETKMHTQRVALLSEKTAENLSMNKKAAFFGGLLHDMGKLFLADELLKKSSLTEKEYGEIKKHAIEGFLALKGKHLITACCAGLHHAIYDKGYGMTIGDFPKSLGLNTIKMILDIATIVSICDFIDAAQYRKTKVKDDKVSGLDLKTSLFKKYPGDHIKVSAALSGAGEW